MELVDRLQRLSADGVKFTVEAGTLKVRAPKGVIGSEESAFIKEQKEAITSFVLRRDSARERPDVPAVTPAPSLPNGYPLSAQQLSLWTIDQAQGGSNAYNLPLAFDIQGELEEDRFRSALAKLVLRHESLRTRFTMEEGEPRQVIAPPFYPDLRFEPADEAMAEAAHDEEGRHVFTLNGGALCRFRMLRISATYHVFILNIHHAVSDAVSIDLMLADLFDAYVKGDDFCPDPLSLQYKDYSYWREHVLKPSPAFADSIAYWQRHLAEAPALLELPTDKARPKAPSLAGKAHHFEIPRSVGEGVQRLASGAGVTPFMVFLAAYHALLGRLSGSRRVTVGVPTANRNSSDLEKVTGYFVNSLPVYQELRCEESFEDQLARIKETVLTAFEHQHPTFLDIVHALNLDRTSRYSPLFQAFFAFQQDLNDGLSAEGLDVKARPVSLAISKFDLSLYITQQRGGGFAGTFEYSTELFEAGSIAAMGECFVRLLGSVLADPKTPLGQAELLSSEQRERLVSEWNRTKEPLRSDATVPDLIEESAARHPERVAITGGDGTLTYAEVSRQSRALAAYLHERGVKPGDIVGVALERTPAAPIALLAVLKLGAAYLPIDPTYPLDRIDHMIADSGLGLVITERTILPLLGVRSGQSVIIDDPGMAHVFSMTEPPALPAHPGSSAPAYMIYTSGSTGKPKGVTVDHRNVVNLFLGLDRVFGGRDEPATWLALASVSFDVSVLDLFWTLTTGATMVIPPEFERRAPAACPALSFCPSIAAEEEIQPISAPSSTAGAEAQWIMLRHADEAIREESVRTSVRAIGAAFGPGETAIRPLVDPGAEEAETILRHLEAAGSLSGRPVEPVLPAAATDSPLWGRLRSLLQRRPESQFWIKAQTAEAADRAGAEGGALLLDLLEIDREAAAEAIDRYRKARARAGLDAGRAALIAPAFLTEDADRLPAKAKEALHRLIGTREGAEAIARRLEEEDGLIGPAAAWEARAEALAALGADDIACLPLCPWDDAEEAAFSELALRLRRRRAQRELALSRRGNWSMEDQILDKGITHVQMTPSAARQFFDTARGREALARLDTLLVAGEALPSDLAESLVGGMTGRLVNGYGPTEATVYASMKTIDSGHVTIGKPLPNVEFYVVGPDLRLLPQGVPGELLIGGEGVASGYHQRPALTAERFIELSLPGGEKRRVYRTGDLVRWTPDGEIAFLGRIDHQVKIRGLRVEIGEIESQLSALPGVAHGAVTTLGIGGELRLIAFLVMRVGAPPPTREGVAAALGRFLPSHMLPERVALLERLPTGPSGKLDRLALAKLAEEEGAAPLAASRPPETPREREIAELMCEIVDIGDIAADEDFFRVGGNSLTASRFVHVFNERFGDTLTLPEFWEAPTVETLAMRGNEAHDMLARLREASVDVTVTPQGSLRLEAPDGALSEDLLAGVKRTKTALLELLRTAEAESEGAWTPISRGEPIPATPGQKSLWFLTHLGSSFRYVGQSAVMVKLSGDIRPDLLQRAVQRLCDEHEALRTRFSIDDRKRLRMEVEEHAEVPWELRDFSSVAAGEGQSEAMAHAIARIAEPYDFSAAPLFRTGYCRLNDEAGILYLGTHHLVADGLSRGILEEQALDNYRQLLQGTYTERPRKLRFLDYAYWQNRLHAEGHLDPHADYWEQRLRPFEDIAPFARLQARGRTAGTLGILDIPFPAGLAAKAASAGEERRRSLYAMLMTALHLALRAYTGRTEQLVTANLACRHHRDFQRSVGNYADSFLVVSDIPSEESIHALDAQVARHVLEAQEHSKIPSTAIFERVSLPQLEDAPVIFHFLDGDAAATSDDGLTVERLNPKLGDPKTMSLLEIHVARDGAELRGTLSFNDKKLGRLQAEEISRHFTRALMALCDTPELPIGRFCRHSEHGWQSAAVTA